MFEAVAAVERGGSFVFGLGFKSVAARGNVFLDEFKELRPETLAAMFFFNVYFLDPNNSAARLLRVSVGEDAVAEDVSVLFKDESIAVWRTLEEKIEGIGYIFFGNVLKHRRRGIKIPSHFGVDWFVVFSDFSDCHFVKVMYFSCGEK